MKLLQDGEKVAFDLIYARYKTPLFSYLRSQWPEETASDLLQEIFLKILNGSGGFAYRSSVKTWIWTLARNTVTDHLRSAAFRHDKEAAPLLNDEGEEELSAEIPEVDGLLLEKTNRVQLERCLSELPDNQRNAILFQTQSELSYEETAKLLELSVSALKSLLFRIREKLVDCFRRGGHLD